MNRNLVVFDFDWCVILPHTQGNDSSSLHSRSMVDQDTDRWVFEVLAPELRREMKTLKADFQWTDLV